MSWATSATQAAAARHWREKPDLVAVAHRTFEAGMFQVHGREQPRGQGNSRRPDPDIGHRADIPGIDNRLAFAKALADAGEKPDRDAHVKIPIFGYFIRCSWTLFALELRSPQAGRDIDRKISAAFPLFVRKPLKFKAIGKPRRKIKETYERSQ